MSIARQLWPFGAALFVFLAASTPVEAQDVICVWCWQLGDDYDPEVEHMIASESGCGADENGADDPGMECVRCGGTSECHYLEYQTGPCHIACGPAGDAMAAMTELQEALEGDDVTVVASALERDRTDFFVEFIPEAGRIDVILPCDPTAAFRTIPVLPEARAKLQAALRAHPTATAIQASLP